jgi:hypothetical protein
MIIIKKIPIMEEMVESIICDCCKKEYTDEIEIQEFFTITQKSGYGSVFGDGNVFELDLCQYCQKKLFGDFIRIREA